MELLVVLGGIGINTNNLSNAIAPICLRIFSPSTAPTA